MVYFVGPLPPSHKKILVVPLYPTTTRICLKYLVKYDVASIQVVQRVQIGSGARGILGFNVLNNKVRKIFSN